MLQPGDRVGDWIVDRTLGRGGMGAVYLAHNALTVRIVAAVKVVAPEPYDAGRARFVREVEALDALHHDAIVRVKGWGEVPGRGLLWMAMDFVEGGELTDRIADGPVPLGTAATWFAVLADGLQTAHARGFRHRDIKPANILIRDDGLPCLVDFGIAMADGRTRVTADGKMPGTPAYMAPEVFELFDPDPVAMDLYALGQVLYETLTGSPAFPEHPDLPGTGRIAHLIHQKLRAEPLDPGDTVPAPVRDLVRMATDPDPSRRLTDAAAFRDALLPYVPDAIRADLPLRAARSAATPPRPRTATGDTFTVTLPRPTHRAGLAWWAGAALLLAGATLAAALGLRSWLAPPDVRDAVVLVGGLPTDTPVFASINGEGPSGGEGHEFWFSDVPVGPMHVAVAAGDQCDFLAFDGETCPPCCACYLRDHDLAPGWEPDLTPVSLFAPDRVEHRDVVVLVEDVPGDLPVEVRLSGAEPSRVADGHEFDRVPLGPATVAVFLGACDGARPGCSADGTCPDGCASDAHPIGIPCGAGPTRVHVPAPTLP